MRLLLGLFKLLNFGLAAATLLAYLAPFVDPRDFWPLIFFGLAYPIFLVGNLLFIIFWFLVERRLIWLSAITLTIGLGYIPQIIGFNFLNTKEKESLKVLSLNSGHFYHLSDKGKFQEKAFSRMSDFLNKEKFDLACFQEFSIHKIYRKQFAKKINPFFKNSENKPNSLFTGSNGKIEARGKIKFKQFKGNGISWSDNNFNGKKIRVYNFHLRSNRISPIINKFNFRKNFFSKKGIRHLTKVLPLYKKAAILRVDMLDELTEHISKCPYPIILCGDMNEPPVSYIYREITKKFNDTFVEKGFGWGKTYNGKIPGLRIDYIFVSPEIEVVDFKIIKNDFSDHFPVICNLKLSEG